MAKKLNIGFIGGTGRCGTSILRRIIASHSQVAALPTEYKLTIEPEGVIDYYNSFSSSWSPYLADQKLKRLESFLYSLSSKSIVDKSIHYLLRIFSIFGIPITPKVYLDLELSRSIPSYLHHVDTLINELTDFTYSANRLGMDSYTLHPKIRYASFATKSELQPVFKKFISNIIRDFLQHQKKDFFIEDNTWNILFANDLLQILPDAKFISIIRDPRDVVTSLANQPWMPNDKTKVAIIYNDIMSHWLKIQTKLPVNRWIQIKLEDLTRTPEKELKNICSFLELPWEAQLLEIDLTKSNSGRWKKEIHNHETKQVLSLLQENIELLGYE
ncbi:MAG: hypothetical protein CMG57_01790 [Candidatus Marinimicrobia bacterium]|nr:hypothetical protein [Candidatus Neomarinimicrobiota bacterium]